MINEINDSNLAFGSLRNVKVKGFKKNPEFAQKLLERFNKNEGVDSFLHEFDADLILEEKGNIYKLILKVVNPNKSKTNNFFHRLFITKNLKIKKSTSDFGIQRYLNPNEGRHYVEIETVGKDGSRGYYTPNNINDDIQGLRTSIKENSPEYKKAMHDKITADRKRKANKLSEDNTRLNNYVNSMIKNI